MHRRRLLAAISALSLAPAGCLDDGGTDDATDTPTETGTATGTATGTPTGGGTPTQAEDLGTIEYTVTNDDDEPHRVEVTMEDAAGRVVQETTEPALGPGESVGSGSAGYEPDSGPFTLTFATGSDSGTYEWDVRECGRIDLRVTVADGGALTVERELCQN